MGRSSEEALKARLTRSARCGGSFLRFLRFLDLDPDFDFEDDFAAVDFFADDFLEAVCANPSAGESNAAMISKERNRRMRATY